MAVQVGEMVLRLYVGVGDAALTELGELSVPVRARLLASGPGAVVSVPSTRKALKRALRAAARAL